jgi:hypothetical protein
MSLDDDPPDVIFRDARIEIKEAIDPGRKRHAEYKEAYARLSQATDASVLNEMVEVFEPVDITPTQIGEVVLEKLTALENQYDLGLLRKMDLLVYINLQGRIFKSNVMPDQQLFSRSGWRSISALRTDASLVFYASDEAPQFLQEISGAFSIRKYR